MEPPSAVSSSRIDHYVISNDIDDRDLYITPISTPSTPRPNSSYVVPFPISNGPPPPQSSPASSTSTSTNQSTPTSSSIQSSSNPTRFRPNPVTTLNPIRPGSRSYAHSVPSHPYILQRSSSVSSTTKRIGTVTNVGLDQNQRRSVSYHNLRNARTFTQEDKLTASPERETFHTPLAFPLPPLPIPSFDKKEDNMTQPQEQPEMKASTSSSAPMDIPMTIPTAPGQTDVAQEGERKVEGGAEREKERPSTAQGQKKKAPTDPFYGHEEMSRMSARFIISLFNCPDRPPPTSPPTPQPTMAHFIAYSLHRTRLPHFVTLVALLLLHRLKTRFPAARGSSGHRLFISAFMIASKIVCDDTYSNNSWCIVGQKMFTLKEMNQMEREMCGYLEWNLNAGSEEVEAFERIMVEEHGTQAVLERRRLQHLQQMQQQQEEEAISQQAIGGGQHVLPDTAAGTPMSVSPTPSGPIGQQQQQQQGSSSSASYPITSSHADIDAQAQAYALAQYQAQQREIAGLPNRRPRPSRASTTSLSHSTTYIPDQQQQQMHHLMQQQQQHMQQLHQQHPAMSAADGPAWVSTGGGYLAPPPSQSGSSVRSRGGTGMAIDNSGVEVFASSHPDGRSHWSLAEREGRSSVDARGPGSWEAARMMSSSRPIGGQGVHHHQVEQHQQQHQHAVRQAGFEGRLSSVDDDRRTSGSTHTSSWPLMHHQHDVGTSHHGGGQHSPHPSLMPSNDSSNQSSPESQPCQTPSPGISTDDMQHPHHHHQAPGPVAIPGTSSMGTAGLAGTVHSTSAGIVTHHHTSDHEHEYVQRPYKLGRSVTTSASYPVARMQMGY